MLILRQHNYTFGEQKAIEQFMKLTHNGRAIPRGYKNLTAKDIVKLRDVAKTIDSNGIKSLNPETAKYYLNKLGFTETANNYERLVDKYNNPELIERFKKRKLREQLGKRDQQVLDIDSDLTNKLRKLTKGKSYYDWNNDRKEKLDRIISYMESHNKSKRSIKKVNNLYEKGKSKVDAKIEKLYDQRNKKVSKIWGKDRKKISQPSIYYIPTLIKDRDKVFEESAKRSNITSNKDSIKHPIVNKKLVEEQRRQLQNGPRPVRFITTSNPDLYNNASADSLRQTIKVPKKFKHGKRQAHNPFTIGHEAGHLDGFDSKNAYRADDSLISLVNELGASAHSIAKVTPKVSKKVARQGRRQLEHSGNTYWSNFIKDKNKELGERLGMTNEYELPHDSGTLRRHKNYFDYFWEC